MSFLSLVSGPLIGGVIGYVTNYLAIKMLFRPVEPVYIGTFRLPFTPGIVPRRKDELAEILGRAVVAKFFNADDLEIIFTSDYLCKAFADSLADLLYQDNLCLSDLQSGISTELGAERMKEELCVRIAAGVVRSDLAALIAREGGKIFSGSKARGEFRLSEDAAAALSAPLAKKIKEHILVHGREIIMPLLDEEFQELSAQPVGELADTVFGSREMLCRVLERAYQQFMSRYVRQIVETIDVGGMITEKVKLMSAVEIESLVLDVVNRELGYVIWLGAALGMVIGLVNSFI